MMNDPFVQERAYILWTNTLAHCSATSRQELGLWIGLNTQADSYIPSVLIEGTPVSNMQLPRINLLPVPNDQLVNPGRPDGYGIYVVGSLHTHTPMEYISALNREVGPSTNDVDRSRDYSRPGLVYDYVEDPAGSGVIPGGHPTGAPVMLYPTGACPRRPHK